MLKALERIRPIAESAFAVVVATQPFTQFVGSLGLQSARVQCPVLQKRLASRIGEFEEMVLALAGLRLGT